MLIFSTTNKTLQTIKPNRQAAPPLGELTALHFPEPRKMLFNNGLTCYFLPTEEPDVVVLEMIFEAGCWQETQAKVAELTGLMLLEGTSDMTGQTLLEKIEYFGATISAKSYNDFAKISIHTLSKYLSDLLPLLKKILTDSKFEQSDFDKLVKNRQEKLLVKEEKLEYLADVIFHEKLFGEGHPYGYRPTAAHYEALELEQAKAFYINNYMPRKCAVYIAGKVSQEQLTDFERYFGSDNWAKTITVAPQNQQQTNPNLRSPLFSSKRKNRTYRIPKEDALQSAIRIGGFTVNKTHEDYFGLFVVNTLLGGYFGSRLMSNLREDKGYTYGIYSMVGSYLNAGYWLISAEVNAAVHEKARKEIFLEIDRLKNELIEEEELILLRNYLIGNVLSVVDGAFNLASTLQAVYLYKLNINFLYRLIETIKNIGAEEIRDLVRKYLNTDENCGLVDLVVVGEEQEKE